MRNAECGTNGHNNGKTRSTRPEASGLARTIMVTPMDLAWDLPAKQVSVTLVSKKDQAVRLILRRGLETVETGGRKLAIRNGSTAEVALKKGVPLTLKIGLSQ